MAYTAVLTKKSVDQRSEVIFNITFNAKINDGVSDVLDVDITVPYNINTGNLDVTKAEAIKKLKEIWDKWEPENDLFQSAGLDTALADIQSQANTYINS